MIVTIEENEDGELILPIPDEMMSQLDWSENDLLLWTNNGDGTFSITKNKSVQTM